MTDVNRHVYCLLWLTIEKHFLDSTNEKIIIIYIIKLIKQATPRHCTQCDMKAKLSSSLG